MTNAIQNLSKKQIRYYNFRSLRVDVDGLNEQSTIDRSQQYWTVDARTAHQWLLRVEFCEE